MKPTWIALNDGGLLRADSIALIRSGEEDVPIILTTKNHELRASAWRLDDLLNQMETCGIPLLKCRRRKYRFHDLSDRWFDVWINLMCVLHALPNKKFGYTEVFLDGTLDRPLDLEEPTAVELMASLRYLSERPS